MDSQLSVDTRWPKLHRLARFIEKLVHLLDSAVAIPGTQFRVGLDPVVGLLLPGVGDALGGVVSLSVLFLGLQYRLPIWVLGRMVGNIAFDAAVGGIPIVGDAFDVVWKSNEKNFLLLKQYRLPQDKQPMPIRYWLAVVGLLLTAAVCLAAPVVLMVWLVNRALS